MHELASAAVFFFFWLRLFYMVLAVEVGLEIVI